MSLFRITSSEAMQVLVGTIISFGVTLALTLLSV